MAAITGLDALIISCQLSSGVGIISSAGCPSRRASNRPMSAPAQKPLPAPVHTIAPTVSSAFHAAICARMSRSISGLIALSLSGLFIVSSPTRPLTSLKMVSYAIALAPPIFQSAFQFRVSRPPHITTFADGAGANMLTYAA